MEVTIKNIELDLSQEAINHLLEILTGKPVNKREQIALSILNGLLANSYHAHEWYDPQNGNVNNTVLDPVIVKRAFEIADEFIKQLG